MANLKNRRGSWYARVRMVVDGKKTEKQIPLKTSSKVTARRELQRSIKLKQILSEVWTFPFLGYLNQVRPGSNDLLLKMQLTNGCQSV